MKLIPRQQTTPQPLRQASPPSVGIGYIQVYLPWAPPLPQGMTEESLSPPSYFFRPIPPFPTQQRQTAPRRPTLPAAPPKRPTAAMTPPRRPSLPAAPPRRPMWRPSGVVTTTTATRRARRPRH